jgi:hypothetical protein
MDEHSSTSGEDHWLPVNQVMSRCLTPLPEEKSVSAVTRSTHHTTMNHSPNVTFGA